MKINFFVKLKYQSSIVIISVDIKYSVRYLFVTSITIAGPQSRYASHTLNSIYRVQWSHTVNDVSARSDVSSP